MSVTTKITVLAVAAHLAAAAGLCQAQQTKSQAWPNKPIRLLVGFPPGGLIEQNTHPARVSGSLKTAGGVFQNGIDLISTNAREPLKELIDRCAAL